MSGLYTNSVCGIKTEDDPQTGYKRFSLTHLSAPPDEIGLIAGDAIHCLRSALDHLAYQLVLANGETPSVNTCFPVFRSQSAYQDNHAQRLEGMSQAAQDEILATLPYRKGNDILWLIHKLDIDDKHHALLTTVIWPSEIALSKHMRHGEYSVPDRPLEVGQVFFTCKPEGYEDIKFTFDVSLGEPGIFQHYPIVGSLKTMLDVVDNLILDFKSLLN